MALRGVGEAGEDVPGGGDREEDERRGEGVELAEAGDGGGQAAGEQEVEEDDGDGKDDADEAFGEDVEGAGGGEAVAADAEAVLEKPMSQRRDMGHPGFGRDWS